MGKDCCNIKVTETEKGYSIEVTGEDIKDKCKTILNNCCSHETINKHFESCCTPRK